MTADEIAERFPRMFHVTRPGAVKLIERHGLLSARSALALLEADSETVERLTHHRRPYEVPLKHPTLGTIVLNDNKPISKTALEKCLDDDLTAADWLHILNGKVFFWADENGLDRLLGAKANAQRDCDVLVLDTAKVAEAHLDTIAFSPINSGSTIRKPARRGLSTFAKVKDLNYDEWRRLRGRLDQVLEITVDDAIPDAGQFIVDIRTITARP